MMVGWWWVGRRFSLVGRRSNLEGRRRRLVGRRRRLVGRKFSLVGRRRRLVGRKITLEGRRGRLVGKGWRVSWFHRKIGGVGGGRGIIEWRRRRCVDRRRSCGVE